MKKNSIYQKLNSAELDFLEKRYNFIADETSSAAAGKSLNHICLKKVKEISQLKERSLETDIVEKKLKEYRDFAISNLK